VRSGIDCSGVPERERKGYDALLLLDVLEHIAEPIEFLRQIRAAYSNARALILTVPARSDFGRTTTTISAIFRRYSLRSLEVELRAANYRSIDARYFFH
jgi:2-polyprenyl-3-methyl-5-hydroxy-6-metoxy-1,4-benzoquinol methylase